MWVVFSLPCVCQRWENRDVRLFNHIRPRKDYQGHVEVTKHFFASKLHVLHYSHINGMFLVEQPVDQTVNVLVIWITNTLTVWSTGCSSKNNKEMSKGNIKTMHYWPLWWKLPVMSGLSSPRTSNAGVYSLENISLGIMLPNRLKLARVIDFIELIFLYINQIAVAI